MALPHARSNPALWIQGLVLLLLAYPVTAVELGNTRPEVLAKHGAPRVETAEGCVYQWADWTLSVGFADGVVRRLTYTKAAPLSEADLQGVLVANGGATAWTKPREGLWLRTDGARAQLIQPQSLVLEPAAPRLAPAQAAPPLIAPPKPIPAAAPRVNPIPARPQPPSPIQPWQKPLNWWPLLLLAVCAKYLTKRPAPTRWFGPSAAIPPAARSSEFGQAPTMDTVSWAQFELVVAEGYRRQGYEVEFTAGLGADGGIDVKLTRAGETVLVQCKQWKSFKINVKEVRAFYGVLVSEGAQRGIFVSLGEYTRDCRAFAEGKPMELLSRADLQQMVAAVEAPGEHLWDFERWLPTFVAAARIPTPNCPKCGRAMTLRQSDRKPPFWGCSAYPGCRGKRDARLELLPFQSQYGG